MHTTQWSINFGCCLVVSLCNLHILEITGPKSNCYNSQKYLYYSPAKYTSVVHNGHHTICDVCAPWTRRKYRYKSTLLQCNSWNFSLSNIASRQGAIELALVPSSADDTEWTQSTLARPELTTYRSKRSEMHAMPRMVDALVPCQHCTLQTRKEQQKISILQHCNLNEVTFVILLRLVCAICG